MKKCHIEFVIYSRPSIRVGEDDSHNTLTPFHIIYGKILTSKINETNKMLYVTKASRYPKKFISNYCSTFHKIYLNELYQNRIYCEMSSINGILPYNWDIVLIEDDNYISRGQWHLSKVDELIVSRYGSKISRDSSNRGIKLTVISK